MSFARLEPLSPAVAEWVRDEEKERKRRALNRRLQEAFAARPEEVAARNPAVPWQDRATPTGRMWHEEAGHFTAPAEVAEISDADRRFAFSAEGYFSTESLKKTGRQICPDANAKKRAETAKLLEQTLELGDRMRESVVPYGNRFGPDQPFECFRDTPYSLFRYFVHSRHVERLPGLRRVMFLPTTAQQVRRPLLSALESFLDGQRMARMWTMTNGPRVPLHRVRGEMKDLHRKISTLNAAKFMRRAGVQIVFRTTELGTPEFTKAGPCEGGEIERGSDGVAYFHLHAHLVVILRRPMNRKQWKKFRSKVSRFWVHWWKDGGEDKNGKQTSGLIQNGREVCKYMTKPAELLKLDGAELNELRRQISRMKICQPMGIFAEEIESRKSRWMRLNREDLEDGPTLVECPDWNRRLRKTKEEKTFEHAEKLAALEARGDMVRVVARCMPGFGPCGVSEPVVIVMAAKWNEAAVRADRCVARLIELTAAKFGQGLGEAIRVHKCTSTVFQTGQFPFVETLPPDRGRLSGAELAGFCR